MLYMATSLAIQERLVKQGRDMVIVLLQVQKAPAR